MKLLSVFFVTSLLVGQLSGCSNIPEKIRSAPVNDIQLNQVQSQEEPPSNQEVRWGGEVVSIENNNNASIIQMVQYPLNHYGKPITNKPSEGRFLAQTTEFIDPVVYKQGTLLTFIGILTGKAVRKIDQKELNMPILDVSNIYHWQNYQTIQQDPFYDPFFYNGFYPYRGYYNTYWHSPYSRYRYY